MTDAIKPESGEAVAWASEWQGVGGLARAFHPTEEEADDSARWMLGRAFPLYAQPVRMPTREQVEAVIAPMVRSVTSSSMFTNDERDSYSRRQSDRILALFHPGDTPEGEAK